MTSDIFWFRPFHLPTSDVLLPTNSARFTGTHALRRTTSYFVVPSILGLLADLRFEGGTGVGARGTNF